MPRSISARRALAVAVAATLASAAAHAEPDAAATTGAAGQPTIADLLQRLEAQEQKIRVLERKLEIQEETRNMSCYEINRLRFTFIAISISHINNRRRIVFQLIFNNFQT